MNSYFAKTVLSTALLFTGIFGTLTNANAQQILLTCTPPLVANSDGTDCIRPAVQQKTPNRLSAFSIRTGDGRHLGLYVRVNSGQWTGPSIDTGKTVDWRIVKSVAKHLVLESNEPGRGHAVIFIKADGSVVSREPSRLAAGSALGDRAY